MSEFNILYSIVLPTFPSAVVRFLYDVCTNLSLNNVLEQVNVTRLGTTFFARERSVFCRLWSQRDRFIWLGNGYILTITITNRKITLKKIVTTKTSQVILSTLYSMQQGNGLFPIHFCY